MRLRPMANVSLVGRADDAGGSKRSNAGDRISDKAVRGLHCCRSGSLPRVSGRKRRLAQEENKSWLSRAGFVIASVQSTVASTMRTALGELNPLLRLA